MKYLAIRDCFDCPMLIVTQVIPYCNAQKPRKEVNRDLSIPKHCPLPDLKQDEP